MSKQQRRHFSAADKVKILRLHLLEGKVVSALCEEHGIVPSLFYQWQQTFFENAGSPERSENRLQKQIAALEQRLQRKHEVLSELVEEHLHLKKEFGGS
jgi:transposase-like protein